MTAPGSDRSWRWVGGAGVLMVVCCVVPGLFAAGALGAIGGWLLGAGLVVAIGLGIASAVAYAVWRARRARRIDSALPTRPDSASSCCESPWESSRDIDQ